MDFWIQFALSTAVAVFHQFVKNPESARKYQAVLENVYNILEALLVQLGSTAIHEPLVAVAPPPITTIQPTT